jgi:hypothetical protein
MNNDRLSAPLQLAQADPGFKVPGAAAAASASSAPGAPTGQAGLSSLPPGASASAALAPAAAPADTGAAASTPLEIATPEGAAVTDTSARELSIGAAVFLVLLVMFFFARNAFTHHLVVRRVAPSAAGSAGWLLFVGLSFVSAAAVLAVVNSSRFLNVAITGSLVLVGAVALIGALLVGRR